MFRIIKKEQAAMLIKDGDCICVNAFLSLVAPTALHKALYDRFMQTGHPRGLTMLCSSGFGNWNETDYGECYTAAGAVKRVVCSHYPTMPLTTRYIKEEKLEGYALPLSAIAHGIRAAAGGRSGYLSKIGLGLYVDPRMEGPAMNSISHDELVSVVELDGEEFLYYKIPKIDIAFIKGTAVDPNGNITFEDEYLTVDALATAQACKANGGTVIVQVDRVNNDFSRPRSVIVPGALVDAVVVEEGTEKKRIDQTLSGGIHVSPSHMNYWIDKLSERDRRERKAGDDSAEIIANRASDELRVGDKVNLGIGFPEGVSKVAAQRDMLRYITLTVEAGGIGGLPAPGSAFGASIGADMIADISQQFDFYDGGGLDICFMGALEADMYGNVNVHKLGERFVGIGGFGDITSSTKTVVFCCNFRSKGISVKKSENGISIESEGSIPKIKKQIQTISFSADQAIKRGQRVLYVTERCVFELGADGLVLKEVYPGIDRQKDILDLLDFVPQTV